MGSSGVGKSTLVNTLYGKEVMKTSEPGCKILEAIENGELSQERFEQYLKLQKESEYNTDSELYLKNKREKFKEISKMNKRHK